MPKSIYLLFSFFLLLTALVAVDVSAAASHVDILEARGTVNPVLADYIDRGISKAEEDGAEACIIILDTPGGLLSSTEDIVRRISHAKVRVVVYVPETGWAASAGAFITLSADVAAMAPGSAIGASTPIGGGTELSEDERKKAMNFASAWIESIAEEHGRNKDAARAAVTEAASFSPGEALGTADLSPDNQEALGGIPRLTSPLIDDAGAETVDELIHRLGEGITLANGNTFKIPEDVSRNYIDMTGMERFLLSISDPNIAYILMSIAMLGILIELSHPGLILPGLVGGICLILSIYSLNILEANYAGLLLMLLAFGLFIAEAFTASFGLLFAGGVTSLIIGSLILFSGTPFEVDAGVIATVVVIFTAIFAFVVFAIIRSYRRPITTGKEGMIGQVAIARTRLDPSGTVFVEGALWTAATEGDRIEPGEEVIVTKVEGLKLKVVKKI